MTIPAEFDAWDDSQVEMGDTNPDFVPLIEYLAGDIGRWACTSIHPTNYEVLVNTATLEGYDVQGRTKDGHLFVRVTGAL